MTSEQFLQESEAIIDAIPNAMKEVCEEHGLEYIHDENKIRASKESLKDVMREYAIHYTVEQLEKLIPSISWNDDSEPAHDYNKGEVHCQRKHRDRINLKISELKSQLTENK